jgi:hypothetical protein
LEFVGAISRIELTNTPVRRLIVGDDVRSRFGIVGAISAVELGNTPVRRLLSDQV